MNIHELDSYDLGDAVKFNDRLNPRIWGADEKMRPEVREQLLKIADDFREFLGINVEVKDITVSGSNAAYTYTPHSDIDLHLVVDLPQADASEVYRELFDAKKYAYNDQHDIKIGGYDVELYVQDANKKHVSQGIYSIINNDWVSVPKRRRPDVDDISVRSKFEDLGHRIEAAVASQDYEKISAMADKIKEYRQAGLDAHGEFGPENLAFKILRTQGLIKKLYDARNAAKDQLLSLDERRKKKKKKVKYGYGAYWYPGTAYAGQDHPAGTEGGDAGGDGGESIREDAGVTDEQILKDFIKFCTAELKIQNMPTVKLRRDPQWPKVHKTFGRYQDDSKILEVAWGNRHIMDVLRTVAHELTHKRQHEREDVPASAGETGSEYENEANARAGVLMRDWARLHPEHFDAGQAHDLEESASGYIPTRAQAKDPRFSMALTVDIKPGQVGKEANKLKLKTDRQGHPQIAQANGLFENLYKEYKRYRAKEDYNPDNPPGPEFKPTMPAGTLRVDVSDVYDWYKLGQHISNMKGLGKHDFGAGPPSSIISFGDEDTEHKFIDQIRATGLDVTDIDPRDPKRRVGKAVKTDPTYNVDETIQAPVNKSQDAEQYYRFIMGKIQLGRVLSRQEQEFLKMYQLYRRQVAESIEQPLDEVKMSPSALESWARSPEAQGIRAGFEAEMIFRDTKRDEDDEDQEPDYDYDERPDSVEHVVDFFSNDDYGYGLSPRGARELRNSLMEEFVEWRDEQIQEQWDNDAEDQVRDYMETNVWGDDEERDNRIVNKIDELFPDDDVEDIMQAGNAAPRFTKSSDQEAYEKENDLYAKYKQAYDAAYEEFESEIVSEFESQGEYYDSAREYFSDMMADSGDYDESDFLRDRYGYMSEIGNSFSLDWPYWTGGSSGGGSRDWDSIAESLHDVVGMDVKVGSGYHSTVRKDDRWIIEPDGSLDPDDDDDMGLEIVSPPMPLPQALEKLKAVIDWGNDEADAYTNNSTGLHMGISIPYVGGDVDYVKLVLFMGDEYILDKFGRASNTYAASAMQKLRQNIAGARNRGELTEAKLDPMGALELVQKNLIELASRYVQQGVGNSKYTSAHIKDGYIEFRSPGGDYLSMESRGEYDDIKNTMLRFARAMQIAGSPALERREYAKKLYKLISPGAQDDALKLFSEYAAGTISPEQLKKQWADAVLRKEIPSTGKIEYEVYDMNKSKSPDGVIDTFYATDYDDANDIYKKKYKDDPRWNSLDVRIKHPWFDVKDSYGDIILTVRAKDIDSANEKVQAEYGDRLSDDWQVFRRPDETPEPEKKLSQRAQVAQRLKQRSIWWAVEFGGKGTLVQARDKAEAKAQAEKQDDFFARNRSYVENIRPATDREIEDWVNQQADNEQDRAQIRARVGEPQPAGAVRDTGHYKVRWRERRNGQEVEDSLNIDAENANAAMDRIRSALQAQGRDVISIEANPQEPPPWRQRAQSSGEPIPGSTMDLARQRAAQSSGEFTGAWRVLDRSGEEVYRFSGVGNNQSDANRTAQTWLISQGDRLENQGPFNVVPEMT